jgi:hypothetical protein
MVAQKLYDLDLIVTDKSAIAVLRTRRQDALASLIRPSSSWRILQAVRGLVLLPRRILCLPGPQLSRVTKFEELGVYRLVARRPLM